MHQRNFVTQFSRQFIFAFLNKIAKFAKLYWREKFIGKWTELQLVGTLCSSGRVHPPKWVALPSRFLGFASHFYQHWTKAQRSVSTNLIRILARHESFCSSVVKVSSILILHLFYSFFYFCLWWNNCFEKR